MLSPAEEITEGFVPRQSPYQRFAASHSQQTLTYRHHEWFFSRTFPKIFVLISFLISSVGLSVYLDHPQQRSPHANS